MPMPAKGSSISFSQLQGEFGGSNPISLSEYYGSGFPVWPTAGVPFYASGWPNGDNEAPVQVPTSGAIPLSRYYSSGRLYRFNYILVGGGGGGGSGWPDNIGGGGGGGGGGGIRWGNFTLTLKGLSITASVGAGGAGASYPTTQASDGGSSVFSYQSKQYAQLSFTSGGGGGGFGRTYNSNDARGGAGGLGNWTGNAGGAYGQPGGSDGNGAGGGGGGIDDQNNTTGYGGNGRYFSDLGEYYGGGGGGGGDYSLGATGGAGGGGQGGSGNMSVTAGTDGTGGGGGGGSSTGGSYWGPGARGGHGIFILYYPVSYGQIVVGGRWNVGSTYIYHFIRYGDSGTPGSFGSNTIIPA